MKELAHRGMVSLLLEGGSTLNASALKEGVVDRLLFFLAPKIIGGQRAPGVIGGDGTLRIKDAEPVEILKVGRIGPDILIEAALGERE
jgi:diaminohydroxyphosphoribosylaminopyrimidine deaminase/5-amino-6-(5-phosphoribosylamino)uracil reductase